MGRKFNRRDVLKGTGAAALTVYASPIRAAAPPAEAVTPALIAAARKEGRVVHYTSVDLPLAERVAKAFEAAAPCSEIAPASAIGHPAKGAIWLKVNGKERQKADLSDMIWSVPEQIAFLSEYYTLEPGDLIYSGTPAGVGPVKPGDDMHAGIEGVGELKVKVIAPL